MFPGDALGTVQGSAAAAVASAAEAGAPCAPAPAAIFLNPTEFSGRPRESWASSPTGDDCSRAIICGQTRRCRRSIILGRVTLCCEMRSMLVLQLSFVTVH